MTIHHKNGNFAQGNVLIDSKQNVREQRLLARNAARCFIHYLAIFFKKTVVVSVVIDMGGKEGHSQYQKQGTHKDWWLIILSGVNWLDQLFVKNAIWGIEGLKQLITTIATHFGLDGFVVPVTVNGIKQNQNTSQYQLGYRKRYAKFIGKEDEWETITPKIN